MPTRWSTLRFACAGALIGAVTALSRGAGAEAALPFHLAAADLFGQAVGGAAVGAAIAAAIAGVRNWFA